MTERAFGDNSGLSDAAPARDLMRIVIIVLSIIGLFVAGYLSYAEILSDPAMMTCPAHDRTVFGLEIDCGTVNLSRYAKVGPVPVALLGLLGYIVILFVVTFAYWRRFARARLPSLAPVWDLIAEYEHMLFFGLTLFGFAFSMYLTWAEVVKIEKFCSWCMTSAVVMVLLFVIALLRLVRKMNTDIAEAEYEE